MLPVTIHNYEAFLLDSAEGNLTREQQLALDVFSACHPELAVDLEGIGQAQLSSQKSVYPNKKHLKKVASDLVTAGEFIAYIEQELSPEKESFIEKSCRLNPPLAHELSLYRNTIAIADLTVVFDEKQALKRRTRVIGFNASTGVLAAAASVAVLIMLYFIWPLIFQKAPPDTFASALPKQKSQQQPVNQPLKASGIPEWKNKAHRQNLENFPAQKSNPSKPLLASRSPFYPDTTTRLAAATFVKPDTSASIAFVKESPAPHKESSAGVPFNYTTVVEEIAENDEETDAETQRKRGFWALAGKTLKGLNQAGLKSVNGYEETTRDKASYDLILGSLNIRHHSH